MNIKYTNLNLQNPFKQLRQVFPDPPLLLSLCHSQSANKKIEKLKTLQ